MSSIESPLPQESRKFLLELLDTPSPTGFEMPGQRVWASRLRGVADSVQCDAYGNTWATLTGSSPSGPIVMLEAHADEIGYMVKFITSEGFLRLDRVGGIDHANGRGRKIVLLGDKGPVIGLIGNTAIHIREKREGEKCPEIHELFVDVGASNPAEVAALGLRVGHPAVYAEGAVEMTPTLLAGRALDNRVGGFIIAEVLRLLATRPQRPQATVHVVNAVQEEIGGNGARMITHRLQPSVAVCLDVTHATDTPGIDRSKHGSVKLGGGPALTHGSANHPIVVRRLMDVAEKTGIPLQHESSSRYTGTDTDKIFTIGAGVPSALVSLPLRYMHSVVEMADLRDVDKVIQLLAAFVLSLNQGETFHQTLS
jgi:putative aminopeptidase FrvX